MNQAADMELGLPQYVELLFDPEYHVIGLRPAHHDRPTSYKVKDPEGGTTRIVNSRKFSEHYGIRSRVTRRYVPFMDGSILCVDLRDDGVAAGWERHRREEGE